MHQLAVSIPLSNAEFAAWFAALEQRYLEELTFQEVRRALVALSTVYVERRDRLERGAALDGAGKRAAFGLFYAPLHFLTITHAVCELGAAVAPLERIIDLGCGTGVGGAAWALACQSRPSVLAIDENRWAVTEARRNLDYFRLRHETRVVDAASVALEGSPRTAVCLAYTMNELSEAKAEALLRKVVDAAAAGSRVLVIEPIARRDRPILTRWERAFVEAGGRIDEWSFAPVLPEKLKLLDKAAGLRHATLKARTLYLNAQA